MVEETGYFRLSIGGGLLTAMIALLLIAVSAGPFFWMLSTSFKPAEEIQNPNWIPASPTAENYETVLFKGRIGVNFANSVIVALAATFASLALSATASYGLSRYRFLGRKFLMYSVLAAQMAPSVVLLVPLIILARETGAFRAAQHSLWACFGLLIFLYSTFTLPFCLWMLKSFFDTVPRSLDECALVDGCTPFTAFVRIILPLSLPGLTAAGVFAFLAAWNEYLFALTFIINSRFETMPLALTSFMGQHSKEWGPIMAASTLFSLPAILFFALVQKWMTMGLVGGAVKE